MDINDFINKTKSNFIGTPNNVEYLQIEFEKIFSTLKTTFNFNIEKPILKIIRSTDVRTQYKHGIIIYDWEFAHFIRLTNEVLIKGEYHQSDLQDAIIQYYAHTFNQYEHSKTAIIILHSQKQKLETYFTQDYIEFINETNCIAYNCTELKNIRLEKNLYLDQYLLYQETFILYHETIHYLIENAIVFDNEKCKVLEILNYCKFHLKEQYNISIEELTNNHSLFEELLCDYIAIIQTFSHFDIGWKKWMILSSINSCLQSINIYCYMQEFVENIEQDVNKNQINVHAFIRTYFANTIINDLFKTLKIYFEDPEDYKQEFNSFLASCHKTNTNFFKLLDIVEFHMNACKNIHLSEYLNAFSILEIEDVKETFEFLDGYSRNNIDANTKLNIENNLFLIKTMIPKILDANNFLLRMYPNEIN